MSPSPRPGFEAEASAVLALARARKTVDAIRDQYRAHDAVIARAIAAAEGAVSAYTMPVPQRRPAWTNGLRVIQGGRR